MVVVDRLCPSDSLHRIGNESGVSPIEKVVRSAESAPHDRSTVTTQGAKPLSLGALIELLTFDFRQTAAPQWL